MMAIFSYSEPLISTNLCTSLPVISQTSLSSELIMYVNLSASHIFTKEGLILDNSWTKDYLTVTYLLFWLHIKGKWNSSSNMLQYWHTRFSTGVIGLCLPVPHRMANASSATSWRTEESRWLCIDARIFT